MSSEWSGKKSSAFNMLEWICYIIIPCIVLFAVGIVFRIWYVWLILIPIILWVIYKVLVLYDVIGGIGSVGGAEEKADYKDPSWLRHQYYELGRILQDISSEQGIYIGEIKEWVDKLDDSSSEGGDEKE